MKIVCASVVRDFAMYERCVRGNSHCAGCELVPIDNRERNEGIGVGYNRFIESRPADEDAWYVFCHEDFELKEPLPERLATLGRDSLWGPIGVATEVKLGLYHKWTMRGSLEECKKDGSGRRSIGTAVSEGTPVETFDCQCVIVHASLVQRHHLRFDENLTFDLYAEDFCIAAKERFGVASRILPLKACHWSGGSVQPRYYKQEAYLNDKWRDCCYTGTSSWILGGRPSFGRRLTVRVKKLIQSVLTRFTGGKENARGVSDADDVERTVYDSGFHRFASRREQTLADIGRVRMFVESVSAQRGRDSDSCTGDTLSRIRALAIAADCFFERDRIKSLGECVSKRSGESRVYWNEVEDAFYKIKDPVAKQGLKHTSPEDWFLEHIVHNVLFPDTAYEFCGVCEECGSLRLILRQENVSSETFPTEPEVADYLCSKLGLHPEERYFMANEVVAVTDVGAHSDNVLVDDERRLRFIDPLIRLKRPAAEVLEYLVGDVW